MVEWFDDPVEEVECVENEKEGYSCEVKFRNGETTTFEDTEGVRGLEEAYSDPPGVDVWEEAGKTKVYLGQSHHVPFRCEHDNGTITCAQIQNDKDLVEIE